MDVHTTPAEAGLGWAVARSRRPGGAKAGGFPGAAAVQRQTKKLVGLIGSDAAPIRHDSPIVDAENSEAGVVTSGTVSPSTQRPIMLAYVNAPFLDKSLFAVVREMRRPVTISPLPFVPKRYKK